MNKVNRMYFSKEAVENGELQKLIDYLMSYSYSDNDRQNFQLYCDIHIRPEDIGAFVVEWTQEPWSGDWGGSFQYVDEDQLVMTEYEMPDGHFVYFENEEEYRDHLEEWLKENPKWHKHPLMNRWVENEEE